MRGPWPAAELSTIGVAEIAAVLGQDPDHPLLTDFASALRDVGDHVESEHGGRFENVIEAANGSALALADLLAGWCAFADVSTYDGRSVPFFKRAQIAAADVARAGLADLAGLDRLTAFADNLVPQVLRLDGVLRIDPDLERRIEAERAARARLARGGRVARLRRPRGRAARRRHTTLASRDRRNSLEPRRCRALQVPSPDRAPATRLTSRPLRRGAGRRAPRGRRGRAGRRRARRRGRSRSGRRR